MKDNQEREILEIMQEMQYATVEQLANKLYLSPSSVRRKLNDLQAKGLIIRTHGGAKITDESGLFPSFTFRTHQNSFEKKKIALQAVKFIKEGDVIFLDGSTSAFYVAEYLGAYKNVKVITNGIDTLSLLSKTGVNAYSTGGRIEDENRSVLVGQIAINTVNDYHADVVFFSAQSTDKNGQIYDCFEEENYLRQAMIRSSTKKIFLCDGTKFEKTSPYKLCAIKDIDYILSDKDISDFFNDGYKEKIIKC
ncbi:MAG: DeoR/GlpR transcriptional regulator [Clostridia bacterium]|nr:DeoR/GlpR transcriptional regulator [Clostridia bacterium]